MTYTGKTTYAGKCLMLLALAITILTAAVKPQAAEVHKETFKLYPNPPFASCFGSGATAEVTVVRGNLADTLFIKGQNFQPNLDFDLFTTQRTQLLPNGQVNPNFTNFGLAWYQTDLQADQYGNINATIHTILLDQIFGFDPDASLAPTNTFHVGFWFNNPQDAVPCGFNAGNPTPFNGQHKAGPNAMISVPNAKTNLGPLCTAPVKSGNTFVCNINQ
jgi:hypothetical protein